MEWLKETIDYGGIGVFGLMSVTALAQGRGWSGRI